MLGKSFFPIALRGFGSEYPAAQASWFFQWLDIDWCGIHFNRAIRNLVVCREVSDTYVHAAYSFGSYTFKLAYSINVGQAYAMLLWFRLVTPQRRNLRERTSIFVITTDH